jgi:hypothetical protein
MGDIGSGGRPAGRRIRLALGGTAVAATLGVGAFLITDHLTRKQSSTTDVGALAPATTAASSAATAKVTARPTGKPSASKPASASAGPSASASAPPVSDAVRKRVMEAREQGEKYGVKVTRPLTAAAGVAPVVDLRRTTTGSLAKGIVRLVTARSDLTGQQELGWVAGGVIDHGDDKCTQTFRLSNEPVARKKPTLLLCWRTSADKSVVAAIVDPKGRPSTAKALTAVDDKWDSMG